MDYFSFINGCEPPSQINKILQEINSYANGKVAVCLKEIPFSNASDRSLYCQDLRNNQIFDHNEDEFGTMKEALKQLDRKGTLFLTSCREPRGNVYTHEFSQNPRSYRQIAATNRSNGLDWHCTAMMYMSGILYVFDPRLDLTSPEFSRRTIQFHFRARITDFLSNNQGLPIRKIFIGSDGTVGNCRAKSLEFIKNMAHAYRIEEQCNLYTFNEFLAGPNLPSVNRYLEIHCSIPYEI